MRNMTRDGELLLDAQMQFARFRLKAVEAALSDLRDMQTQLEDVHDWPALAAMPATLMRLHSGRSASVLKSWLDLFNDVQAARLHHLAAWREQLQQQRMTAAPAQFFTTSAEPMQAFFNSLGVLARPDSEARSTGPTRATSEVGNASAG
nr:hypothetical protein RSP597_25730 [Ralstonia solanacearum]